MPAPLVPARALNEWTYCRRLGILEWLHGEFADNRFTVEGSHLHRRVDWPGAPLEALEGLQEANPKEILKTRSVYLESEREGLVARTDLVELRGDEVVPIDTKRGRPPRPDQDPTGVWEADRVQLAAQCLVLRDHGYRCTRGFIFYATIRRRVEVVFDEAFLAHVRRLRAEFVETAERSELPPPLVQSPKCRGCSLQPICLPDETTLLTGLASGTDVALEDEVDDDPLALSPEAPRAEGEIEESEIADDSSTSEPDPEPGPAISSPRPRMLLAPKDERRPLYVSDSRARVGAEKDLFVISTDEGPVGTVRVRDTNGIAIFGRAQISTMAVREAMDRGMTVSWFTSGGYFAGMATGHMHKNVVLREAQYRTAFDADRSFAIARAIVRSKVRNQRTMLRRNASKMDDLGLREMAFLAQQADRAKSVDELLGLEGAAAAIYFRNFGLMLKARDGEAKLAFDMTTRNRRPPRDPINALLSAAYAFLTRDCSAIAQGIGLDPYMGIYHRPKYGKPALALDLMEEFRPLIADSVVLSVVNQGEVSPSDFVTRADGCNMTDGGRRALLRAYERRMGQEIVHPIFRYRASWRRIIEIQARLLGRHMLGEIPTYRPVETR